MSIFFTDSFSTDGTVAGTSPEINTSPRLDGGVWTLSPPNDYVFYTPTVVSGKFQTPAGDGRPARAFVEGTPAGTGPSAFVARFTLHPSTEWGVFGFGVVFFIGDTSIGFEVEHDGYGLWMTWDVPTVDYVALDITDGVPCTIDISITDGLQTLTVGNTAVSLDSVFTAGDLAVGLRKIDLGVGGAAGGNGISNFRMADSSADFAVTSSECNIFAPAGTVATFSGANISVLAPAGTVAFFARAGVAVHLAAPSPTLYALGHDSTGENSFIYTAPSPTLSAYGGANAKLTAPTPTLTTTATGTNWGSANITASTPTLSATGTTSGIAQIDLTAPSPNLIGYGGAVCSITLTGSPTVAATGTTGSIGGAQITAPLFALAASGTAQNFGGANLIAPAARLGAQAQAWLIAPGAYLTAIGTATITATHEAYALNLNHTPRKGNEVVNDELTHYTNFPFTHVVRYQNSYFGANSTGLYLLEGTTDNGAPIEWEVKTAYTDFDSAQHKTLEMAYFGGRLGPEATISLYAGEQTTNPYEYTTPRGAAAQNYRQPFGRGQKARYYALGASGDDVVTIDSITLNVATLARKV